MTERPDRPDPLDRLRALQGVDVPDQWDEIVNRAGEPERSPLRAVDERAGRPRWLLAAAAATVLALGTGAVIAFNGDDDGEITTATLPPTTAPAPVTTRPVPLTVITEPETSPPPTVDTVPTTASAPAPADTTTPATAPSSAVLPCAETVTADRPTSPLDPALGELGPLATAPNLVLSLTDLPGVEGVTDGHVVAEVDRVAGGIVVLIRPDFATGLTGWQLAAIDDGGHVRWQRCGTDDVTRMLVGPADAKRSVVDLPGSSGWHAFDLQTGAEAAPLGIPVDHGWEALNDRYLVAAPGGPASGDAGGPIAIVDLATGAVIDTGTPPSGLRIYDYEVRTRPDGSPLITLSENLGFEPTIAVYRDGEWRTDRDALVADGEIRVTETFEGDGTGNGPGLLARDALGASVWFEPTDGGLPGEGFHTAVLADVVVANVCNVQADGVCQDITFQARELLTGELLWERAGYGSALAWSDRFVFTGSALLDLRTGAEVQQDELPTDTFFQGCCGEDTFLYTAFDGGVVWAVNYEEVQVFYAAAAARPTTRIDLTQ